MPAWHKKYFYLSHFEHIQNYDTELYDLRSKMSTNGFGLNKIRIGIRII